MHVPTVYPMPEQDTFDIAGAIYSKIANGLIADKKWQISPQNFARYDNVQGTDAPDKQTYADGDYPRAILKGPISGETDLQTGTETFGTYSDAGCDWLETSTWVFELVVTSDYLGLTHYSPQTMESINAVRRAGAKIGLAFVTSVKAKFVEKDIPAEDGNRRIESTITITVQTQYDGQSLTGGN